MLSLAALMTPGLALAQAPAALPIAQAQAPATTEAVIAEARAAQPVHPHPMYGPKTLEHTRAALAFYEELAAAGGWPFLPGRSRA